VRAGSIELDRFFDDLCETRVALTQWTRFSACASCERRAPPQRTSTTVYQHSTEIARRQSAKFWDCGGGPCAALGQGSQGRLR